MNLVRYNPNRRMAHSDRTFSNLFDGFFDDFYHPFALTNDAVKRSMDQGLKVDIYEKDDKIVIEAELAGVEKDDIHVDIEGKILTLGGERKFDNEIVEENRYRRERSYGTFERKFSLPFEADSDSITAHFKNGVLKLDIPKPEVEVPKKIAIS